MGWRSKVVVKNYGLDIRSGSGAVYAVVGNAPEGSEYRIVGRNRALALAQDYFCGLRGQGGVRVVVRAIPEGREY